MRVSTRFFLFSVSIACLMATAAPTAFALDLEPPEIRGKTQQLPVSVLQNRYFTKTMRPELGLSYGKVTNEAYTDTAIYGVRGAIFLNEWLGFEFQSLKSRISDTDDRRALNQITYKNNTGEVVKVDPEINKIKSLKDFNAIVAPFYGKMNFADWLIIYSDVYLTGGMAQLSTDQGPLNALSVGIGQRLYWQKSLSLRLDFRDRIYTEKRSNQNYKKSTYSIDFGLSYFLF